MTDEAVAQKEGRKTSLRQLSSLVPIQTKGTKPPFYCVHGAGGNVLIFKALADYLGLDQPFYGFQAQGVDGKQPPLTRIEDMAALYVKELREFQPHGPYYIGGFSMGGEVAVEMAHQLLAVGETVGLLVLFDTFNPDRPIRNPKQISPESNGIAATVTVTQPGKLTTLRRKAMGHVKRLSAMGPREQLDYIVSDARMRGNRVYLQATFKIAQNTGRSLPYSILEQYLWECNLKAVYNYPPKVYPGRITLFRAVESLEEHPLDHPMSWGPLAGGGLDVHIIEGTHRLIDEPYVAEVVAKLEECLEKAQAEASGWAAY